MSDNSDHRDLHDSLDAMKKEIDAKVMARLRAPFGCEFFLQGNGRGRWRIHDANDDAIATVHGAEEGYARLIVQALNEHFETNRKAEALEKTLQSIREKMEALEQRLQVMVRGPGRLPDDS